MHELSKRRFEEAVEQMNETLERDPYFAGAGVKSHALGEHRQAAETLAGSVKADPTAKTFASLGFAHLKIGEFDKAIEHCASAIQLDPYLADAFLCRGCAYSHKGEFMDAYEDFFAAVSLDPDRHPALTEQVQEIEREQRERWDELLNSPESDELLSRWSNKISKDLKAGETTSLEIEDM
ncbi:MAG: hypothetical protein OXT69_11600 [Candidatus Poribacteria bacterium]|nr:hypothetical protein [Candidatus Poribacteria bacterium]